MHTFSTLVDHIVQLTSRYDRRELISQSINSTIRDMHLRSPSAISPLGAPIRYSENLIEVEFDPGSMNPVLWSIPRPQIFMDIAAARCSVRNRIYEKRSPQSLRDMHKEFSTFGVYYRTGNKLAFLSDGAYYPIQIAYFIYLPTLAYLSIADREVEIVDGEFVKVSDGTAPTQVQYDKETNWMLARHSSALLEGAVSRVYRALNDLDRSKIAYSAFNAMQIAVQATESHE